METVNVHAVVLTMERIGYEIRTRTRKGPFTPDLCKGHAEMVKWWTKDGHLLPTHARLSDQADQLGK